MFQCSPQFFFFWGKALAGILGVISVVSTSQVGNCCSFHFVSSIDQETMFAFHLMPSILTQIPNPQFSNEPNMPYVHAKVIPLKCLIQNGILFLAKNICGRLSKCLSSFHQQQQRQQHHNTSLSNLDDINLSLACFYGFSPYAWKLKATVSTFPSLRHHRLRFTFFGNSAWFNPARQQKH